MRKAGAGSALLLDAADCRSLSQALVGRHAASGGAVLLLQVEGGGCGG